MGETPAPTAYVISVVEGFGLPAAVARYADAAGPSIDRFGGHFVISNSLASMVEGNSPLTRLSMIEFSSLSSARAWYDSSEYAEALALTSSAFQGRLLIFVEGNAPQPT
jgi:uncharacterized protein (DUF1330 family)